MIVAVTLFSSLLSSAPTPAAPVALFGSLPAATTPTVAVMPVRGPDPEPAQAAIRGAVAASTEVNAVATDALGHLIERAAASGISCEPTRADCATRICAFGGLDFVIVARLEDARATLSLHDCVDGRQVRAAAAVLGAGAAARDAGLAALTHAVLGETEARGRLAVTAPAGVVVVDGVPGGPAPIAFSLVAGPHEVAWRPSRGGAPQRRTVEVPAAATVDVAFAADDGETRAGGALASSPSSPSSSSSSSSLWPPLALGGLAVGSALAVGGGVGALIVAPTERARYSARQYNDAVTLGRASLGVGVVGAVLAVVAGAALVWVPADAEGSR